MPWTDAGLQASFADGETTPNPWTPPTRTKCGSTLNPSGDTTGATDITNLTTAGAACTAGHYVLMAAGQWYIGNYFLISPGYLSGINNISYRGSGPMSTFVNMVHGATDGNIQVGVASAQSSAPLTNDAGNFTLGSTSIKITTASPPSVGMLAYLQQCDTAATWNGTVCSGPSTDNSGLYVCAFDSNCISSSGTTPHYNDQNEWKVITSVTNSGGGVYTIGISDGIYINNWSGTSGQNAQLYWLSSTYTGIGYGLEDMTVVFVSGDAQTISMKGCYDCWIKGVRAIGAAQTGAVNINSAAHYLISNNYVYAENPTPSSALQVCIDHGTESDGLIINNILTGCFPLEGEGYDTGSVIAYNFSRDNQTTYNQLEIEHHAESSLILWEGNQYVANEDDDTWGTHDFNTRFRNYFQGWDNPYVTATAEPQTIHIDNFARFENVIGNILGSSQVTTGYQSTGTVGYVYILATTDTLSTNSLLRWGNCDSFTSTCRFVAGENPTTLSGNATAYNNISSPNTSLPCSFILTGTATTCTTHANGGTGLGWWKVETNYPTNSTFVTPPFPPNGPDVGGGTYAIGTGSANDIPATIAWKNLPVDTTYQQSYAITGSSFTTGIETLTVTGLPNVFHLMGPMRISGGNCDTAGAEVYMTNSTATTVSYARGGSASCTTGNVLWPDVRQFDESVFQNDPAQITTYSNVNGMVLRGVTSN